MDSWYDTFILCFKGSPHIFPSIGSEFPLDTEPEALKTEKQRIRVEKRKRAQEKLNHTREELFRGEWDG